MVVRSVNASANRAEIPAGGIALLWPVSPAPPHRDSAALLCKADPQESAQDGQPGTAWTLAAQDCRWVAERDDRQLQGSAAAKPMS